MEVAELTGAQLDYWVARATGIDAVLWANEGPAEKAACVLRLSLDCSYPTHFQPSTNWAHGGPIIERENIHLSPPTARVHRNGGPNAGWSASGVWHACTWHKGVNGRRASGWHETSALTAAMRAFVRSKFGDIVPDGVPA